MKRITESRAGFAFALLAVAYIGAASVALTVADDSTSSSTSSAQLQAPGNSRETDGCSTDDECVQQCVDAGGDRDECNRGLLDSVDDERARVERAREQRT